MLSTTEKKAEGTEKGIENECSMVNFDCASNPCTRNLYRYGGLRYVHIDGWLLRW